MGAWWDSFAALCRRKGKSASNYGKVFIKWMVIAVCIGAVGGLVGALFHLSVNTATALRGEYGWLLWLMPLGGVLIVLVYTAATRMVGKGTNDIIHSIHFGEKVPLMLTPVIFLATVITHIVGGSAGREGAALQIGGSIGCQVGRLFRQDDRNIRVATMCGMSAVFAALFGTPLTAAIFALEVLTVGVFYYMAFIPCLVAALTAYGVSLLFHLPPTRFAILEAFDLSLVGVVQITALSVLCALVSIAFCVSMHKTEHLLQRKLPNPYVRVLVGSAVLIVLTLLCGTDYNGAGIGCHPDRHGRRGGTLGLGSENCVHRRDHRLRLQGRRNHSVVLYRGHLRLLHGQPAGDSAQLRRSDRHCGGVLRRGELSRGFDHSQRGTVWRRGTELFCHRLRRQLYAFGLLWPLPKSGDPLFQAET